MSSKFALFHSKSPFKLHFMAYKAQNRSYKVFRNIKLVKLCFPPKKNRRIFPPPIDFPKWGGEGGEGRESCLHPIKIFKRKTLQSWNHLNATKCPIFLKSDFRFPLHRLPLKGLWPPPFTSNNQTIVDQVIALA